MRSLFARFIQTRNPLFVVVTSPDADTFYKQLGVSEERMEFLHGILYNHAAIQKNKGVFAETLSHISTHCISSNELAVCCATLGVMIERNQQLKKEALLEIMVRL